MTEEQTEIKKFSDVYPTGATAFEDYGAERMEIPKLLNKEIVIQDCEKRPGKYTDTEGNPKDFIVVLAKLGDKYITFGSSGVLMNQINQAKEDGNLPLIATIITKKSNVSGQNYYTLS